MVPTADKTSPLSITSRARIAWACARYDFWLDLESVPRRHRRELRRELKANLLDARTDVGTTAAIANVGSLRALATETTRNGQLRSPWQAGLIAGLATFGLGHLAFMILGLYYSEGVLDAGATEPVTSSLFPFAWSEVIVDPSNDGLAWTFSPGPTPLVAAVAAWLVVAKPWRALSNRATI